MTEEPIDPAPAGPAYAIPFENEEAAAWVGVFVATWAQVDFFMGVCIALLLKIDVGAAQTLMENMTSGPRLNLFHRLARDKITDADTLVLAKAFYKEASLLIDKRNHLLHGMWGWHVKNRDMTTATPAVHYTKNSGKPLYVSELRNMSAEAAKLTVTVVELANKIGGKFWSYDPKSPPHFLFGAGPPPDIPSTPSA